MILRLMDYSFSCLRRFAFSLAYDRFRWFLLPTGPQSVPACGMELLLAQSLEVLPGKVELVKLELSVWPMPPRPGQSAL